MHDNNDNRLKKVPDTFFPPLVDLQVNGFRGIDFSSPELSFEQIVQVTDWLSEAGTTAYLATLITSPPQVYRRNLPLLARGVHDQRLKGRLLGVHLEGPFLNPAEGARGAHNPDWMISGNVNRLSELIELGGGTIRLLTIAADIDGAETIAGAAREKKIAVSLGHHLASTQQIVRLRQAGATAVTHLGNGLPRMIDRHTNPLWAAMADDLLTAMIITDGHHLPLEMIGVILRAKTPRRVIVTSDSSPLAGMAPGRYHSLGNDCVLDPSGRLYNPTTGYLVGSSATMRQCMAYLGSLDFLWEDQLRAVAWENPMRLIAEGLD